MVTCRSKKPVSAMINAVNNFCVLAAGRTSSAFFSYKICPVRASTMMTDLAPVAGIPPETRGGAISSRSSSGLALGLACKRGDRVRVSLGGDSFGGGSGTPVGRTLSISSANTATGNASAQSQRIQRCARFIGGKLVASFLAPQANGPGNFINPGHAESARSRNPPAHR